MSSQTVFLKVRMSCQGCAGAVNRVLEKMEGVESFNIDLKEQKVTVKGNVKPEDVLETVSKSGKKTEFWEDEAPAATPAAAETQNQPSETATPGLENKTSETATVVSDEPENKPAVEAATLASAEPESKPAVEAATTVA